MPPNKRAGFIKSFMEVIRTLSIDTDCHVHHKDTRQFVRIKNKTLTLGYASGEEPDEKSIIYHEKDLIASIMIEFDYLFAILIENFSLEYDCNCDETLAES